MVASFAAAAVLSVVLGYVPYGRNIIYPFALLATWAHEMGHGLGALLTGNSFLELELYRSLGGQATTSGADGWEQVVVSSAGLLGPAIAGAIVMIAGSRARTAPVVLGVVGVCVLLSVVFWIRNLFGVIAMTAIGAVLVVLARYAPALARVVLAQVIAVQMALSAWSSRDYLFVEGFERNGYQRSDTGAIEDVLVLPHWIWGGLIGAMSIGILVAAFRFAWLRPAAESDATALVL